MSVPASPPVPVEPATVASWQACRDEVAARLAPCVPRPETRGRLQAYLDGLLSDTRRKNGWQLAETVGEATPYGSGTCWGAPSGRSTRRGMPCMPMSPSTWGMPTGWSSSTRPASPSRGPIRPEWRGSTVARWARSATARWGSA